MKSIICFFIVVFSSFKQCQGLGISCQIEPSISSGTNNVVITISPSPLQVIEMAGLKGTRPAQVIVTLLNSTLNPAFTLEKEISNRIVFLVRFLPIKIPTCKFLWITNQLFCNTVPSSILQPLCNFFKAISSISSPITIPMPTPQPYKPLNCTPNLRWGLNTVRAPDAWAIGARGAGIVVANLDSGVRSTHQELAGNMRPYYNFYNALNPSNYTPFDDVGHGTHTMGSICGKTVGVAPDATWIACKGCDFTGCRDQQLLDCAQWFMCPDKQILNCTTKPNVINNSWGGNPSNTFYNYPLALMKQVGIMNVFATGNSGPLCSTLRAPANVNGTEYGIITVGATDCNEAIGEFSSTGPSISAGYFGGLGVQIVGPGVNILSAWNTNDTATNIISGTSTSCPHVTGAVAVLLSKNYALTIDQVRTALVSSSYRNPTVTSSALECTTASNTGPWPNNVYGYGRLDVLAALNTL